MRVQPRNGKPGRGNAEIALERGGHNAGGLHNKRWVQPRNRFRQRFMNRHRHDPQFRTSQHHHGRRAQAGQFAQKFRVARMWKARRGQAGLLDGVGHHARSAA